jgi:hypothetical protein
LLRLLDDGLYQQNWILHLIGHAYNLVCPPIIKLAKLMQDANILSIDIFVALAQ